MKKILIKILFFLIITQIFLFSNQNFHLNHNDWQNCSSKWEKRSYSFIHAKTSKMLVFTTAVTNCWITSNVLQLSLQIYTHNRSSRPRGTPRRLRPRVKLFYDLPVRHALPLQVVRRIVATPCSPVFFFFFFSSQKRSRLWIMTVSIIKGRYELRLNRKGSGLIANNPPCRGLLQVFLWNDSAGAIIFNYTKRGIVFPGRRSRFFEINW